MVFQTFYKVRKVINKFNLFFFFFFQALLRGALTQQSAVILVCMAIDRYVCMLHPHHYHKHASKKVCFSNVRLILLYS